MIEIEPVKTEEEAKEQKRKNLELKLQMQKENMKILYHQIDGLAVIIL